MLPKNGTSSVGTVWAADAARETLGAGDLIKKLTVEAFQQQVQERRGERRRGVDIWGAVGSSLRDQLSVASSPSQCLRILDAALRRRLLARVRREHPAVTAALQAFRAESDVRVADVATLVGLSKRRFVEVFEREIGLTPKLYLRIQRFHRVKRSIAALGRPESWATFALTFGYFDQSHMIREFVAFSGMSPTSYLQSRSGETMFDHFVHAYPSNLDKFVSSSMLTKLR